MWFAVQNNSKNGVGIGKKMKIIENERTHPYPSKSENKSRCHMCINECNGEEHKKKKQMLCRVKSCCMSCGKNTCSSHLVQECNDCFSAN